MMSIKFVVLFLLIEAAVFISNVMFDGSWFLWKFHSASGRWVGRKEVAHRIPQNFFLRLHKILLKLYPQKIIQPVYLD